MRNGGEKRANYFEGGMEEAFRRRQGFHLRRAYGGRDGGQERLKVLKE